MTGGHTKRIEAGDRVVIVDVGENDSYFVSRDQIIGREAVITFAYESVYAGWQSFEAYVDGVAPRLVPRLFFIMAKTESAHPQDKSLSPQKGE
jgi:hypothetical protein